MTSFWYQLSGSDIQLWARDCVWQVQKFRPVLETATAIPRALWHEVESLPANGFTCRELAAKF